MKKLLLTLLKIGVSLAIIGYLMIDAYRNQVFGQLMAQPKDWWLLTLAAISCSLAILVTLIRWYYLVRALDLPFTLKEAMRLGLLGYLFNLAPMGIVGGDLLKAVMLARQHYGHRAEAVASVIVDRIIGLYMLFVVASLAILLSGFYRLPNEMLQSVCQITLVLTLVGALGIAALLIPDLTTSRLTARLGRLPYVGHTAMRLVGAVGMYRRRKGVLLASSAMSIVVHSLFSLGIYLITRGLYPQFHSLATQFVVSPLAALTGVLPIPLGPFEFVLNRLFSVVALPDGGYMIAGQGLVVALGYRIITVATAAVGAVYYLISRQELAAALHEVEEEPEFDKEPAAVNSLA